MASFVKKTIKDVSQPFIDPFEKGAGALGDVYEGVGKGVGAVVEGLGDILSPDIELPEMPTEEAVDPQVAVTEAAKKKRARVARQKEQTTLLTGAQTTGGTKSLLG